MQPQARTLNVRLLIAYSIIAVVLLALIVGGIMWAKGRATHYAHEGKQQPATAQQQAPNEQPQQQNQPSTATNSPAPSGQQGSVSGAQTQIAAATGPSQVPATGAASWLASSLGFAIITFAGVRYMQSRRRLQANR